MDDIHKRYLLFLLGCIPTRLLLALTAYKIDREKLPYMSILTIPIALGFLNIYFRSPRNTGPEVFGDKIWWNDLRPVHATLYILFSVFALKKNKNAWIFLLLDALLGLAAFNMYHIQRRKTENLVK